MGNFLTKSLRIVFLPYSFLRLKQFSQFQLVCVVIVPVARQQWQENNFNQTLLLFIIDHIHTNCLTKLLARFYSLEIDFNDKCIQLAKILVLIVSVTLTQIQH